MNGKTLLFISTLCIGITSVIPSNDLLQAQPLVVLPEDVPPINNTIDRCTPDAPNGIIDFEQIPDGFGGFREPVDGEEITDQFRATHGIVFSSINGNPQIGKVGNPRNEGGWLCDKCSGNTRQYDTAINAEEAEKIGTFFLATPLGHHSEMPVLTIDYDFPTASASAAVIDIDGGERWTITAYDSEGNTLETIRLSAPGWLTWDGTSTYFSFERPQADISKIVPSGFKNTSANHKFGLSFNDFSPIAKCIPQ